MDGALKQDGGALAMGSHNEYKLADGEDSVWIEVGNVSVHVKRGDDGVSISLYPVDGENGDSIAETFVTYAEAEKDDDHTP